MIRLTRLDGSTVDVAVELVHYVEGHHDTVVTLGDGKRLVVSEDAEEVVRRVRRARAEVVALADVLRQQVIRAEQALAAASDDEAALAAAGDGVPATAGTRRHPFTVVDGSRS